MESYSDGITVSVRYRTGNLEERAPVKVKIDGSDTFSLSSEGVRRIRLSPGMHDFNMRCGLRRRHFKVSVENPTRITIGFCRDCGDISARAVSVNSIDELDYERMGY